MSASQTSWLPISTDVDGSIHYGLYTVVEDIMTVTNGNGIEETQLGEMSENGLAQMLLADLVRRDNRSQNETSTVRERLRQRSQKGRNDHSSKQQARDESQGQGKWYFVTYQGYDADSGLYRVEPQGGSVILAQAQSKPGHIEIGETLVAFCPPTSSLPRLFMPL